MREIKFRAWLPTTKKMTYTHTLDELMNWNTRKEDNGAAIWLQFTGFKDKNGKEIYEGDVIKAESRLWQVDFKDGCFVGVDFKNVAWDELVNIGYGETEVIGNIYGNPELLNNEG